MGIPYVSVLLLFPQFINSLNKSNFSIHSNVKTPFSLTLHYSTEDHLSTKKYTTKTCGVKVKSGMYTKAVYGHSAQLLLSQWWERTHWPRTKGQCDIWVYLPHVFQVPIYQLVRKGE